MATPLAMLTFRQAVLEDAADLHAMIDVAYTSDTHWTNQSALVKGERISIDELRAQINAPAAPFLVAEIDGRVTGCVQISYCRDHPDLALSDDTALLGLLVVHSDFQSMGIGKALFAAGIDFAKSERKCRKGVMFVINKRTDIQAWYERLGFVWNGARREYVHPERALQDDLWFKVYEKEL